jgi:hypothetical protein
MKRPIRTTTREARKYIAAQQDFNAAALSGRNVTSERYVVYSYAEPIASWVSGKGWTVTTRKWSVTTSRHTGIVRCAVGGYVEAEQV